MSLFRCSSLSFYQTKMNANPRLIHSNEKQNRVIVHGRGSEELLNLLR